MLFVSSRECRFHNFAEAKLILFCAAGDNQKFIMTKKIRQIVDICPGEASDSNMFNYCTAGKQTRGFGHRKISGNLVKLTVHYTVVSEFLTGRILLRKTISLQWSTLNSICTNSGTFSFKKCKRRNLYSKTRF
jgi:hypothetical protein